MASTKHPFVQKLRHGARLTAKDEEILLSLARSETSREANEDLLVQGAVPGSLPLIIDGWACRYRLLGNGRRQIIALVLPGDLCEPFGGSPRFWDYAVSAITPLTFSSVPIGALKAAAQASRAVEEALWWDLLMATAIEREHIVNLGRRSAIERVAHLLCELHCRLKLVGRVDGFTYEMPVRQTDVADILGLSTVHVNRSLQELRAQQLISTKARRVTLEKPKELHELSFFDDNYLRQIGNA
jgi:CRP-like cAMP-binding protein